MHTHRCSLPTRHLILHRLLALLGSAKLALLQWLRYNGSATMASLQWLCYNDAIISRLQRVPAKHLRLVQLLRIRLRQAMLRYLVA
eukprot:scaffold307_cov140-Alexandrium_tamarense.AAC.1